MVNPRRNWHDSETPFPSINQQFSLSSIRNLLKKPQSIPFLLSLFLLLAWISLRFQRSSNFESNSGDRERWSSREDDLKANLVRFGASKLAKDHRGWLLNPVALALDAGVLGGAVKCASVHVGEIRPGGMRGNHRHYTCNETFIIWGAKTKFRLENNNVDKGYAEAIIAADEVAIAASPSGRAHALVNMDVTKTTFLLGCQDDSINYNSSTTAYNIWKDL